MVVAATLPPGVSKHKDVRHFDIHEDEPTMHRWRHGSSKPPRCPAGFRSVISNNPDDGLASERAAPRLVIVYCPAPGGRMPASYSIDPDQRFVMTRVWGAVTNDEVDQHNERLRSDPLFDPTYRQLADMSDVTLNLVSADNVQETARDQYFAPGTRRALLVSDDTTFGLCRMYATYAESLGQVVSVFRERKDAEKWLGLAD